MTYKKLHFITASLMVSTTLIASGITPAFALGLSGSASLSASATTSIGGVGVKANANVTVMARTKAHADQEIDRRVQAIATLSARINAMQKVSADQKTSLAATLNAQTDAMTSLKAKVDADTDAATLKADVQSITKAYRIFALVIPQGAIIAASDRGMAVASDMTTLGAKLQARIAAAQAAGANVSAMQSAYADFTAKISDANTVMAAATTEISALTPDNGDQAKLQANTTVLKDARAKIQTAHTDLVAARKDAGAIIQSLKVNAHASASASTTTP